MAPKNNGQPGWPNGLDDAWFKDAPQWLNGINPDVRQQGAHLSDNPQGAHLSNNPPGVHPSDTPPGAHLSDNTEVPDPIPAATATQPATPTEAFGAAAGIRQNPVREAEAAGASAGDPPSDPSIDLEGMLKRIDRTIEDNRDDEEFVARMTKIRDDVLSYRNGSSPPGKPSADPQEHLKKVHVKDYISPLEAWLLKQATGLKDMGRLRESWYEGFKASVDQRVQNRLYFKITSDARTAITRAKAERDELSASIEKYRAENRQYNLQLAEKKQAFEKNKAQLDEEEKVKQESGIKFGKFLTERKTVEANGADYARNIAEDKIIEHDYKEQDILAEIDEIQNAMFENLAEVKSLGYRRDRLSDGINSMSLGLKALEFARRRVETRQKYSPQSKNGTKYNEAMVSLAQDVAGLVGYLRTSNQLAAKDGQEGLRLSDIIRPALSSSLPGAAAENREYDAERLRVREERRSRFMERDRQLAALYSEQARSS